MGNKFTANCPNGAHSKNDGWSRILSAYCVPDALFQFRRGSTNKVLDKGAPGEHCSLKGAGFECWGIWRDFATPVPAYCIDGSILASYWTESNLAELACKDQFDDSCQDEACIRLGGAWGDVEKREPEYEGAGEGGAIVGGLAIVLIGAGILIRRRMRKQATPPLLQVTSATDAGAI